VSDAATDTAGLSSAEADRRRASDGANSVTQARPDPLSRILTKFWAPVPWMLEATIALQLGLREYPEAAGIAVLLLFNAALGFFQESRAGATLDALQKRLAVNASARRDGAWAKLAAPDLVRGDVVKLSLGTVVPADVRLITGAVLIDQSMLTGESVPAEAGPGFVTYAGALIERGEAVALVTATGARTKFGRSADLIRTAHVESTEQKAIFRVVRNLAVFNGCVTAMLVLYGVVRLGFSARQIVPLVLVALLASIPAALPSMFTLAATVGARAVARRGVLPTRLSALDEAAVMDILCADKTGTLTRNALTVTTCQPMPGFDAADVLAMAALASSDGGADPLDAAVRAAAGTANPLGWTRTAFTPFDPAKKMSGATVHNASGKTMQIVKGAYDAIAGSAAAAMVAALQARGYRVLVVACGAATPFRIAGAIAMSDPPRPDTVPLIARLRALGVRVVMVTGDAPVTARVVADAVGIVGTTCPAGTIGKTTNIEQYGVFAGVLPEDKFALVKALQNAGHVVGMCGDGANDAPALRQAQMGIAVSTATDVAKSAAGIVLTGAGLGGIVAVVEEGRATFQRILTFTLRSLIHKCAQVLMLLAGLIMTGGAVLTPLLMVMIMVGGDFFALTSATDNVRASATPNVWRLRNLSIVSIALGLCDLVFCAGSLAIGHYHLHLDARSLQTLTLVTMIYSGQAIFYVARERRRLWRTRPGNLLLAGSFLEIGIFSVLAARGMLMAPLSLVVMALVFGGALALAIVLDTVKLALFRHLPIQ
jgi:H+-transporting ATPase